MQFNSILLGAFAAILAGVSAQSNQVPPPACLQACMNKVSNCDMCTTAGKSTINSCIASTCSRDTTYADAYFTSTCENGGYESYQTSPPHFQQVPDSSCGSSTNETSSASKREVAFQA